MVLHVWATASIGVLVSSMVCLQYVHSSVELNLYMLRNGTFTSLMLGNEQVIIICGHWSAYSCCCCCEWCISEAFAIIVLWLDFGKDARQAWAVLNSNNSTQHGMFIKKKIYNQKMSLFTKAVDSALTRSLRVYTCTCKTAADHMHHVPHVGICNLTKRCCSVKSICTHCLWCLANQNMDKELIASQVLHTYTVPTHTLKPLNLQTLNKQANKAS